MIQRCKRRLLQAIALTPLPGLLPRFARAAAADSFTIAFGSCANQELEQPVWDAILADAPDLFVFLGDNIYGDTDDMAELDAKYQKLAAKPNFAALRASTPIQAIWDDHDYGRNDAGSEYPHKQQSRELMLRFWNEPAGSDRYTRADGVYSSCFVGPAGQIQLILPDLRWNRSGLNLVSEEEYKQREAQAMGPYRPVEDASAQLLGEAQWQWLEQQLAQPAALRIIGTSIQCVAEFTGWETWANFPRERERLLELLARHQDVPTLLLSGDVHWCELSALHDERFKQPLLELTSSGLTETWEWISPNRHRVGDAYALRNYGLIEIDFAAARARLALKDEQGKVLLTHDYAFAM
jgi:alkaline phosphatase D